MKVFYGSFFLAVAPVVVGCSIAAAKSGQASTEVVESNWKPPESTIDAKYVEAARKLLGNGLADPRRGTFCMVTPNKTNSNPFEVAAPRYGWASSDKKWLNGLDGVVSPLEGRIEPAKLETAIAELKKTENPRRFSYTHSDLSPATPAVLLIAGKTYLAEELSIESYGGNSPDRSLYAYLANRYEGIANDDLEQTKDADGLFAATDWAKVLKVRGPIIDPPGARPGFQRSGKSDRDLADSADLVADFQRRVANPRAKSFDLASLKGLDQKTRIARLIDAFGDDKPGISNPGGAMWIADPICIALVAEGNAAVPPLLDAVDNDHRFTRAVFRRSRSEREAGWATRARSGEWCALQMIWPSVIRYSSNSGTPDVAALRTAWQKEGSVPDGQRWVNVLKDDKAEPRLWLEAAQQLVKPAGRTIVGFSSSGPTSGPMSGESLRSTEGAKISQLMNRRAEEMVAKKEGSSMDLFKTADALRLAHFSYRWEATSSLPCLRSICSTATSGLVTFNKEGNLKDTLATPFGIAISDRLALNDASAVQDYAALVPYVTPDQWFTTASFFRPLWTAKDNPQIQTIGTKYMSKWASEFGSTDPKEWRRSLDSALGNLPASELIEFRPYRQLLIAAIENNHAAGETEIVSQGKLKFASCKIGGQAVTNWNLPAGSEAEYSVGQKSTFSIGDYAAANVDTFLKGPPKFSPLLPLAKRNEARQEMVKWLSDDSKDWKAIAKSSPFSRMDGLD